MFELVQRLIAWLVAQFQTNIVQLATMQCASDVDELDDCDDMKNVFKMTQLRQKFSEIHHNHSQVEQKFQYMFQKHCWIEFRQDWVKSIARAILVCIMKQCKSVLVLWIIVMTGEINYIKQKQADVSMIADFEIEAIEIA